MALILCCPVACRDDSDDAWRPDDDAAPTAEETTERVATWFTRQSDPNGLEFTPDEAECAAERVVEGLGMARIEELRTKASNEVGGPDEGLDLLQEPPLATDEADVVYVAMTSCIDFEAQVTEMFAASGQPEATAACMAEHYLATAVPRDAIMAARTDPELMAEISSALTEIESACRT